MKLAVLYAGQGAQHPGMGKEFYEASSAFRAAFDAADLPFDLHRVCFDDPDGVLNQTEYTQPCMVAFACGVSAVLAEQGVKPAYVAGLSLGEYSALEAAGVFTAKQAIELAAYRGKAMADAASGIDCGMTAVLNLDRVPLAECCEQASALGCVQICNYNCPGQLVIGGEKAAVDKAAELAKQAGARRCIPLKVSGPFHTRKIFLGICNQHRLDLFFFYQRQRDVTICHTVRKNGKDHTCGSNSILRHPAFDFFYKFIGDVYPFFIDHLLRCLKQKTLANTQIARILIHLRHLCDTVTNFNTNYFSCHLPFPFFSFISYEYNLLYA